MNSVTGDYSSFGTMHSHPFFCVFPSSNWSGITSGIFFSSVVIPLVVHPSEAVQEGFDVRFCFIRRIRLRRRLRFLCCRLRSGDLKLFHTAGERFPDRGIDLFQQRCFLFLLLLHAILPGKMIVDGGVHAADLDQRLRAWQEQAAKLKTGEITKEDYDRWRYHYPEFDDTSIRVPIPAEEPARSKRGRKPHAHSVG